MIMGGENMNIDKLILIELLNNHNLKSQELANRLGVSSRTIKNYVKQINQLHPNTISSSRNGYLLSDIPFAKKYLENNYSENTKSNRLNTISNILINSPEKINIYDLADKLYYSETTIRNDLRKLKTYFKQFDIELIVTGDYVEICGYEVNKRKVISDLIYKESNDNFLNLAYIQKIFSSIDISLLNSIVLREIEKQETFINDYYRINLILHLAIIIDRIQNGNKNNIVEKQIDDVSKEVIIAKNITSEIQKNYNVTLSNREIYELSILISSRINLINDDSPLKEIEAIVGKDCINLVNIIFKSIYKNYGINLDDIELKLRFAIHLSNLLKRTKNNYESKNPLADEFQASCPFIFEIAVYISSIINKKYSIDINKDEIAYIAFHIGNSIEIQRNNKNKISASIICPNYYDIANTLSHNINNAFSSELIISNIFTTEIEIHNTDLIISTVKLKNITDIPVVYISPFFNKETLSKISKQIKSIQMKKSKQEFEKQAKKLVNPDLFEVNETIDTKEECIDYLASKVVRKKFVSKKFKTQILEREKLASTAFGNFAIPHSMVMDANQTGLNVLISKDGINWDDTKVYLVIMMFFKNDDRDIFNEFFEKLTDVLTDNQKFNLILQSKNYREFIHSLVEYF